MTYCEINNYYKQIYGKDFPRATLTKWVKEGKIKAIKESNGRYNYDFESFKNIVNDKDYSKKVKAKKENPVDYINTIRNDLLITGIVPPEEKKEDYKGTLMYCKCLRCGRENVQVRFSYLTPNGNYQQETCGCGRKERAFLSSSRPDLTPEHLRIFSEDFEKFLVVHKILIKNTEKYYTTCPINEYVNTLKTLYFDKQFNAIYNFWLKQDKNNTYYDWAKPSLDHKIPKSKGGTHHLDNLQILTVFENLSKRDMTLEEWEDFKRKTNTTSDYYIENILREEENEFE